MCNSKTDTHRTEARIKLCSDITKKHMTRALNKLNTMLVGFFKGEGKYGKNALKKSSLSQL